MMIYTIQVTQEILREDGDADGDASSSDAADALQVCCSVLQ